MKKITHITELPIDSTRLCCNFVNTVHAWKGEDQHDYLEDYNAFLDWCINLSVFEKTYLEKLRQLANKEPDQTKKVFKRIIRVRLLIHDLISSIANNNQHKIRSLLSEINPQISDTFNHMEIEFSKGSLTPVYKIQVHELTSPLWVIFKSLYDLLIHDDRDRIKECPSCGWVFYDETKNGRRRWCNPLNCGTKDKMDRYTQKLKEQY